MTRCRAGGEQVRAVSLLGSLAPLQWRQEPQALTVQLPEERPCEHAWVLKVVRGDGRQ
jgi:alpha-L-fucosidase